METRQDVFQQIDLMAILGELLHKLWLIIIFAVIGGVIACSYASFYITPMYRASALFYVNSDAISVGSTRVNVSSGDLSTATRLIQTYSVIIKTRSMLNEVIERGNLPYSTGQLSGMISAGSVNGTEVFSISVTNSDPAQAAAIANLVADVLPDKIAEIIEGSSVRIVDYAVIPGGKISPDIPSYTMKGVLYGLVAACALIVLRYIFFDYKIHSEDYLMQTYGSVPLLAVIPDITDSRSGSYSYYAYEAPRSRSKRGTKK